MKEFRKNEQGFFVCEECGKLCKNQMSLSKHLPSHNMNQKDYYDKWLKSNNDGICDICGKETEFKATRFYRKTCSRKCADELFKKVCLEKYGSTSPLGNKKLRLKGIATSIKKYGTTYPCQSTQVKETCKQNNLKKYGVENTFQTEENKEKMKKTWLAKYGVDNPNRDKNVREKIKQTCIKRFGTEYALQNSDVREKGKITMNEKYGVDHQSQNETIHYNQMNSGKRIKIFRNTDLWYQGTFELDFLENYFDKIEIKRAKSIKFIFDNEDKYYHPDFYIPTLNLIVEIKNSYYAKRDKEKIKAKEKATISSGFNYIMIVDKDYNNFNKNYL